MKIFKKIRIYFIKKFARSIFKYSEPMSKYWQLKNICFIENLDELIEKGTKFDHPTGIVLGYRSFGNNCRVYQNVTTGGKYGFNSVYPKDYPAIGNNVTLYAGCAVIGGITIGDNAVIGANAVVTKDVPANCIAYGNPAVIIDRRNDE